LKRFYSKQAYDGAVNMGKKKLREWTKVGKKRIKEREKKRM